MQNMNQTKMKYLENIKDANAEIEQAEFVIKTARDQLENGVEIKEVKQEE
jgi:predicted RNase H-like nuclease (RuvC/YqgF family)